MVNDASMVAHKAGELHTSDKRMHMAMSQGLCVLALSESKTCCSYEFFHPLGFHVFSFHCYVPEDNSRC